MGAVRHRGRKKTWFVAAAAFLLVWFLNAFWGVVLESQGEPVVGVVNGCVVVCKVSIKEESPILYVHIDAPIEARNTSSWKGLTLNVFEQNMYVPTLASRFGFVLPETRDWAYESRAGLGYYVFIYNVPLLPLLAVVLLSVWCAARFRRKHRKTHMLCYSCNYNLTGNISGICPECGTPMDDNDRQTRIRNRQ